MAKNKIIFLFFLVLFNVILAKPKQDKFIVYFKDKPVDKNVERLFSKEAVEYRKKINIPVDERDFPVDVNYIEQLKNERATIINTSNWLNASLISIDIKKSLKIQQFPFVSNVIKVEKKKLVGISSTKHITECVEANEVQDFEDNYNTSFPQVHLLNGEYLHEQGFNGENMTIAICDNGFYRADSNLAFKSLFDEHRILGTYDYVHNDSLVYDESGGVHGSNCLSFIAAFKDSHYIGTATKSNFYLFHTENNSNERLQEEFNLAVALERCYQLGVDVVSISLGYTTFDIPSESHDTSDFRLNNTPASKAVNIASSKGMLVCVAAGNEGAKPWKYISSPADADSAFCIASVDINGNVATSSGHGLPNDSRIKPNISAVGVNAKFINSIGNVAVGNGTSYATPQIAGLAACLWQAFPTKTNWEIKTAIEQSASQFLTPDKRIGYGIPDFKKAYDILTTTTYVSTLELENKLTIYPNPVGNILNIQNNSNLSIESITLLNHIGQLIFIINSTQQNTINIESLASGLYLLKINTDKGIVIKKIIKE